MTDRIMDSNGVELDGPAAALLDAEDAPTALARRRVTRWVGWFDDGAMLVRARVAGSTQLFRLAAPGQPLQSLAPHELPTGAAALSPDGARLAFTLQHPQGARLYVMRLVDRSVVRISGEARGCTDLLWARDSRRIAFRARPVAGAEDALLLAQVDAMGPPRMLLAPRSLDPAPQTPRALGWSADDRTLLVSLSGSTTTQYMVDVASGSATPVLGELALDGAVRFAPGGRALYALARADDGLRRLHYLDLASGERRVLTPRLPWDIERFAVSSDGRQVAVSALAAGYTLLRVLDLPSGALLEPPALQPGFIDDFGFDRDGARLAFTLESADSPADAWSWDLRRQAATRWTVAPGSGAAALPIAVPRRLQLPAWDAAGRSSRTLPGWVTRPASGAALAQRPVWLAPRLGNATRMHPRYDALTQYLVGALGYVALMPDLGNANGREAQLRDLGAVLVWIGLQRDLDPSRTVLAVSDESAELLLPMLAQYGERLRAGVQLRGAPQLPRGARASLLSRPVLLVHGRDDLRWAGNTGERSAQSLRALGNEAWRVALPAEAGGRWVRPENEERCAQAVAAFLRQFNAPTGVSRAS